jgi:hypothetical protein
LTVEKIRVRKTQLTIDRVHHDGGSGDTPQLLKAVNAAVISNPFAGRYEPDLAPFMESLRALALGLANELVAALGGRERIETFGKGSIVGSMGELEHAAMWHTPGGAAAREALGGAKAQVPASKKIGALGTQLDIPLHYIHASMVRSHYDVMPLVVPDGPKPNEIVFALAMSTGGRIHARLGGLTKESAKGENGLN